MTALTVAGLTLREAFRRRVVWALLVLTVVLLALSGWGFSKLVGLDTELGTMTSGEARLVASLLLNLIMFGMSLIAAIGTAFLAGPTLAGEVESGQALAMLARPVRRSPVLLGKWLGLVAFGCGYVVLAGLAQILVVRVDGGLLAAGARRRARAARGADGRAADAGPPAVQRRLADGVGHRRGRAVRGDLGRRRGRRHRRGAGQRGRRARGHRVADPAAHRRPVARGDERLPGPDRARSRWARRGRASPSSARRR